MSSLLLLVYIISKILVSSVRQAKEIKWILIEKGEITLSLLEDGNIMHFVEPKDSRKIILE